VLAEVWRQPATHGALVRVVNDIIASGALPQSLATGVVVPVSKGKGRADHPGGYRPIVLLPTLLKLVHKLILFRVRPALECVLLPYQAAFREGMCASMHVAALCELLARARAGGHALYSCFCDFADAYSSVRRDALFALLRSVGVPEQMVVFLEASHAGLSLRVRWHGRLSAQVLRPSRGVLQGDPLAPYLFILAMDSMLRALPYPCGALCDWRVGLRLPCLAYADDVVLLSNSRADAQRLLVAFELAAAAWGMALNPAQGKTEWLCTPASRGRTEVLRHRTGVVHRAPVYKYLGVLIAPVAGAWRCDLKRRLALAMAAVKRSSAVWAAPVPHEVKARLLRVLILPLLEYGLPSYPVTRESLLAVHRATSRVLRAAFGLRVRWDAPDDHVGSEALYNYVPFAAATWTRSLLSAFGHWSRAGERCGVLHPVVLTCCGATEYQSPFSVRAALEALSDPVPFDEFVAVALRGGPAFTTLVNQAVRRRFRRVVREQIAPFVFREVHVAPAVWSAMWKTWGLIRDDVK
jgi:hypothetical protein